LIFLKFFPLNGEYLLATHDIQALNSSYKIMNTYRLEHKYYIPEGVKTQFLNDLQIFTHHDKFSRKEDGFYEVSSIYMDNYHLNSYREKMTGANKRQKVRFRFYPPVNKESSFYIELKNRGANKINKFKTRISSSLFSDIIKGNSQALELNDPDPIIAHVARLIRVGCFHLYINVSYKRVALFAKTDRAIRITLDSDVFCSRFQGNIDVTPHIPVLPQHLNILEIKAPGYFPDWLRYLIKKYELKREAISKYGLSVQNLALNNSMAIK
jgi:hypothetical protein